MNLGIDVEIDKTHDETTTSQRFWESIIYHHYYIAQDADTKWHSFSYKPIMKEDKWVPIKGPKEYFGRSDKNQEGGWRKTLRLRPNSYLMVWFRDVDFVVSPFPNVTLWFDFGEEKYCEQPFSFILRLNRYSFSSWTEFRSQLTMIELKDDEAYTLIAKKTKPTPFFHFNLYEGE